MKKRIMISLLVLASVVLVSCSQDNQVNTEEKDNLGNIGKIMRSAEYTKVIKDYRNIKSNEHDSEALDAMLTKVNTIVMNKKNDMVIDSRIGNYGNVEVRKLLRAEDKSLIGLTASLNEVETVKVSLDKDNTWTRITILDNDNSTKLEEKLDCNCEHGFYIYLEPKLEKINNGKCLGEVSGKTYIICEDDYGRDILYVIGFYENKRYTSDWDINILQFVSQDGSFQDNCRDVYNVENTFIFKDGSDEVNTEVNRVMNMYKENELYKTVRRQFK